MRKRGVYDFNLCLMSFIFYVYDRVILTVLTLAVHCLQPGLNADTKASIRINYEVRYHGLSQ